LFENREAARGAGRIQRPRALKDAWASGRRPRGQ
jgi:hypothetical protein